VNAESSNSEAPRSEVLNSRTSNIDDIELIERFADAPTYCALRTAAGMAPKTIEAAERGLKNTLYGVSLRHAGDTIGMGRIIGDSGCFFVIVDIAVLPAWQGRGLGKRIMTALDAWLRANVPESAYVNLVADGDAKYLYEKFGFAETAPASVNMEYIMGRAELGDKDFLCKANAAYASITANSKELNRKRYKNLFTISAYFALRRNPKG
jgi:GNAT superfamily N-acetyltransferase